MKDDFKTECNAELVVPAFTREKPQLTGEVEESRTISNVCIHIERVIGLLKRQYTILKGVLPIKSVQSASLEARKTDFVTCDKVVQHC